MGRTQVQQRFSNHTAPHFYFSWKGSRSEVLHYYNPRTLQYRPEYGYTFRIASLSVLNVVIVEKKDCLYGFLSGSAENTFTS